MQDGSGQPKTSEKEQKKISLEYHVSCVWPAGIKKYLFIASQRNEELWVSVEECAKGHQ